MLAFKAVTELLRTPDDYELTTYRMLERLAKQGVVHAEVYVSVGVIYYWRKAECEARSAVSGAAFSPEWSGKRTGRAGFRCQPVLDIRCRSPLWAGGSCTGLS